MAEQAQTQQQKPDAGEFKTFARKDGSVAKIRRGGKAAAAGKQAAPASPAAEPKASSGSNWLLGLGIVAGVAGGLFLLNTFTSGKSPAQKPAA
jgi:hypothetical protein